MMVQGLIALNDREEKDSVVESLLSLEKIATICEEIDGTCIVCYTSMQQETYNETLFEDIYKQICQRAKFILGTDDLGRRQVINIHAANNMNISQRDSDTELCVIFHLSSDDGKNMRFFTRIEASEEARLKSMALNLG